MRRSGASSRMTGAAPSGAAEEMTNGDGIGTDATRFRLGIGCSRMPSVTKNVLERTDEKTVTSISRRCFRGMSGNATQGRGPSQQDAATIQS